jgi:hypothetical protein
VIDITGSCRRHRPALLDFVDRGEIGPSTADALGHLDRCDRCTADLESTMLAITALRRLGDDAAAVEPSADAWPRLRARLDRWRRVRWTFASPRVGTVMGALLVALIVGPLQFGQPGLASTLASPPSDRGRVSAEERVAEAAYIARRGVFPAVSVSSSAASGFRVEAGDAAPIPRKYPDNLKPERKEVTPAGPSRYPPEAI